MHIRLTVIVLVGVLGALLRAQSTSTVTAPLNAKSWEVMPLLKTQLYTTFDSVGLVIPEVNSGFKLNYLMTTPKLRPDFVDNQLFWLQPLIEGDTLVVRWRITVTKGNPTFDFGFGPNNPCDGTATVSAFMWAPGFEWFNELARWWSRPDYAVTLTPGYSTMQIPLTPESWISVFGRQGSATDPEALQAFRHVLDNPGSVGITAGGGCYLSHGVTIKGGVATIELVDYHFEPATEPPVICTRPTKGPHGEILPCCC